MENNQISSSSSSLSFFDISFFQVRIQWNDHLPRVGKLQFTFLLLLLFISIEEEEEGKGEEMDREDNWPAAAAAACARLLLRRYASS